MIPFLNNSENVLLREKKPFNLSAIDLFSPFLNNVIVDCDFFFIFGEFSGKLNTYLSDKSLGVELPDPNVAPVVELLELENMEKDGLFGLLLGLTLGLPKLALNFSSPVGFNLVLTPMPAGLESKLGE